ncbi:MAG: tetratricopeptide repeat protein, partial [Ignavibacteriae bacterium]|nr:tetratricopeptide repeat protein [Ignavibacteriota bacterium]
FEAQEQISFDVYDMYLRGLYELRKIKPESNILALTYFTQAVEKDSRFARGFYALANAQLFNYERGWDRVERWLTEAERNCQKALSIDSTLSEAYGVLGRIATARGELQRGLTLLEKAITKNPNDMHSLAALGIQYEYNLNDPMKAIDYFRRAMELSPNDHRNIHNMAYGYYMLKNYSEAKRLYRRVLLLNPTFEPSWINLGVTFSKLNEYDSAITAYQSSLDINPANSYVRDGLSSLYIIKKDSAAERILLTGLNLDPTNYRLRYSLGVFYSKTARLQKANQTWTTTLNLLRTHSQQNPNLAEPLLYSSLCYARLGQQTDAVNAIHIAYEKDSTNSDIVWGIARVHSLLKQKQKMLEWFKKAKSMSPEFDEALLKTEIDFEYYFSDEDLLAIARM